MQTIQASEFKAKSLALMDEVARSGEVLVVTKNGRQVAELRPYSGGRAPSPFGLHRKLKILGDINAHPSGVLPAAAPQSRARKCDGLM